MSLSILAAMLAASAADRWWKALIFGIAAALAARFGLLGYLELAGVHQSQMAVADALVTTAMTAAVISPIAYIFAVGRSLVRHDERQGLPILGHIPPGLAHEPDRRHVEHLPPEWRQEPPLHERSPVPGLGQWRAPSDAASLIDKRLGWPAWLSVAIGFSALIALWAFTPDGRDRWVNKDGAVACQGATEIEDIQSMQSASSRRYMIEDLVAEKKCVPLFADDRVRIREIGEDGSKVRVVLRASGQSKWMQLADLKPNSPTLLTTPWFWKEEPVTASGFDEKANPFADLIEPSTEPAEERSAADTPDAQDSKFASVKLPRGVKLLVPKGWWLPGKDLQQLIETAVEAATDLSTIELPRTKEVNLIAANSLPAYTYAALRIDSSIPPSASPIEVATLGTIELNEISRELLPHLEKQMQLQGNRLIELVGTRIERISGHPTIVTEYRRTGPKGSVFVQINRIITEGQEVSVNLSYRESEVAIWKPVVEKMRQSIVITQWP